MDYQKARLNRHNSVTKFANTATNNIYKPSSNSKNNLRYDNCFYQNINNYLSRPASPIIDNKKINTQNKQTMNLNLVLNSPSIKKFNNFSAKYLKTQRFDAETPKRQIIQVQEKNTERKNFIEQQKTPKNNLFQSCKLKDHINEEKEYPKHVLNTHYFKKPQKIQNKNTCNQMLQQITLDYEKQKKKMFNEEKKIKEINIIPQKQIEKLQNQNKRIKSLQNQLNEKNQIIQNLKFLLSSQKTKNEKYINQFQINTQKQNQIKEKIRENQKIGEKLIQAQIKNGQLEFNLHQYLKKLSIKQQQILKLKQQAVKSQEKLRLQCQINNNNDKQKQKVKKQFQFLKLQNKSLNEKLQKIYIVVKNKQSETSILNLAKTKLELNINQLNHKIQKLSQQKRINIQKSLINQNKLISQNLQLKKELAYIKNLYQKIQRQTCKMKQKEFNPIKIFENSLAIGNSDKEITSLLQFLNQNNIGQKKQICKIQKIYCFPTMKKDLHESIYNKKNLLMIFKYNIDKVFYVYSKGAFERTSNFSFQSNLPVWVFQLQKKKFTKNINEKRSLSYSSKNQICIGTSFMTVAQGKNSIICRKDLGFEQKSIEYITEISFNNQLKKEIQIECYQFYQIQWSQ